MKSSFFSRDPALTVSPSTASRPPLSVCAYLNSQWAQTVQQHLDRGRYLVVLPESDAAFFQLVEHQKQQLDCLILEDNHQLPSLVDWLHKQGTLLPLLILEADTGTLPHPEPRQNNSTFVYHTAEVRLSISQHEQIVKAVESAIAEFINLSPSCQLPSPSSTIDLAADLSAQNFLLLQQRRLTEKLKERLGYLGVYYKRDPKSYLRNLPKEEQRSALKQLRREYRNIVLNYFSGSDLLNQEIDDFVNTVFFADISVSQVVQIHMELMDDFSKQLKLEGRSEEILLDYRLTLIDTIAHLCEMYRRSVPRGS